MAALSFGTATLAMGVAALLSAALTTFSIFYARGARLIDEPGRRRSHAVPTPRGGGIAIVISIVLCAGVPLVWQSSLHGVLLAALLLVATLGWVDDHKPLSAKVRFLVQWIAVAIAFFPLVLEDGQGAFPDGTGTLGLAAAFLLIGVIIVWSTNLHNFMDGINGLLALQTVFCLIVLAWLLARSGAMATAVVASISAAAVAGFLPFNFPRARIFMGDVGSGALGFLLALIALALAGFGWAAATSALLIVSGFVTDATCTLLSRMLHGRRWYSAHREHLYQWLVRSGFSHAQVVALYMAWNLVVVLPAVVMVQPGLVSNAEPSKLSCLGWTVLVYGLGLITWILGKRHCLQLRRNSGIPST